MSLYGHRYKSMVTRLILVIILTWSSYWNDVYQELTYCCRSIKLQKQTKSDLIEKEIRFMVTSGGEGKLEEGGQKTEISSYKIN